MQFVMDCCFIWWLLKELFCLVVDGLVELHPLQHLRCGSKWIKSYFSCCQQFVQFNEACSTTQTIKCRVPQGSILGPLFFILYINDLPNASKLTQPILLADDTSIFYSHSDPKKLHSILNDELYHFYV